MPMDGKMDKKNYYGGFWHRVAANILDTSFITLIGGVVRLSMGLSFIAPQGETDPKTIYAFLFAFIIGFCYYTFFQWHFSGTIGKLLLGLSLVNAKDFSHISIGQVVGRYCIMLISFLFLCLGVIWVGFDKRRQGWHDKAAGTVVVKKKFLKELMLESGIFPDKPSVHPV